MQIIINAKFLCQKLTGIGRFAFEISFRLKKYYPKAIFVTPNKIILHQEARVLDAVVFGNLGGAAWEQIELPFFLLKFKKPLLLNFSNTAPIIVRNQINTIHDITTLKNPEWYSKKEYFYHKLLTRFVATRCLKLITVSQFVKDDLIYHLKISENKISVIYNSVSDVFINETLARRIIKEKYMLCVGSIHLRKNLQRTVQAFLDSNLKNYKLVIVGFKNAVFSEVNFQIPEGRTNDIIFTGYVSDEDLKSYYRCAKVFLYPSLEEGFGIPPLEAMANGCVVLTSHTSSLPEVCGDAAYYVDPFSIESIKKGISELINNEQLRNKLRANGFKNIKRFNWDNSAHKVLQIINELK
ncbi:MAG: glycosyltransferase family 1 protein [Bacteroidota bacterium]|nr:glycosyltransferase family 1 protein [Bacteroidota bacterium]